jgi:Leucine-rich repeat (LRR) protein
VLQLPSLEILDLSRNKLRTIPDEIRNLSSLKVLSLDRNRIERLPVCLGEMNTLVVLKVEDNPLVFPPIDLCVGDERQARGNKKYVHLTIRIKEFLRRYTGHHSRRWHSQAETEVDFRWVAFSTEMDLTFAARATPKRPALIDRLAQPADFPSSQAWAAWIPC